MSPSEAPRARAGWRAFGLGRGPLERVEDRFRIVVNGVLVGWTLLFCLANLRAALRESGQLVPQPEELRVPLSLPARARLVEGPDGPMPPTQVPARPRALAAAPQPGPPPAAAPAPAPAAETPLAPVPLAISPARPARLLEARVESSPGGFGMELRFDVPVLLRSTFKAGPRVLELTLFPVHREGLAERLPPLAFMKSVTDVGGGRKAVLRIQLQGDYAPRPPLPAGEGESFRLDFEASREEPGLPPGTQLNRLARQLVVEGLHEERYRYKPAGEEGSDVFVLEVDPRSPELELGMAYGDGRILGKERVSSMARRAGALAAVNASFFSRNGDPLGLLAEAGNVVSMPLLSRGVLGLFDGGQRALIGNPGFSGRVDFEGGSLPIDGVNQVRKAGKVILYTPEWGERTGNPGGGLEVAVEGDRVVGVADGNVEIPPAGYVVAVQGGEAARVLSTIGMSGSIRTVTGMTPPWNRADFAIGGGPVLMRGGKVRVEWREESFARTLVVAKAPRTAVGVRADGKLLLVVLDGRRAGVNRGVDLYELADILAELGCREALNLDGGGSSTLFRDGRIQNRPSDGGERSVSTALVIRPGRRQPPPAPTMLAGQPVLPAG